MLQEHYSYTNATFLAHGYVGEILGKTINGVLMHSNIFNVVALIDKKKAGIITSEHLPGVNKNVPVVQNFEDTLTYKPKVVILMENSLKESITEIIQAIENGCDIINPSFNLLQDYKSLVELANKNNVKLIDLRTPKNIGRNPDGSILNLKSKIVFTAGTDCGLGKRTATYEMYKEAKNRGINAAFAATGQTGIMLGCDGGVIMDSLKAQYIAGAIEEMIVKIDKNGFDIIFLEGQGSIMHYGTSSVVSLLHAGNPHAIVMVHDEKRKMHVEYGDSPIFKMCKLKDEIEITEKLSLPGGNQFKVVAVATIGDENIETLEQMKQEGDLQNLPIADARKEGGPKILLKAVLHHLKKTYNWEPKM